MKTKLKKGSKVLVRYGGYGVREGIIVDAKRDYVKVWFKTFWFIGNAEWVHHSEVIF